MVAVEVQRSILELAVLGLVRELDDRRAGGFRAGVVGVDILHKHGQRLRSVAQFGGAGAAGGFQHDIGAAEMHLGAAGLGPIAVVLHEAECLAQPRDRFGDMCDT